MVTRGVLAALLVLGGIARADNLKLAEARRALRDVQYEDARELLVEALAFGGSSPAELREIYVLSAEAAAVLDRAELSEEYYGRLLALDPAEEPPAGASPKVRAPFVIARNAMAARGRLEVHLARRGRAIEVDVISNPFRMAVAVATTEDGAVRTKVALTGRPVALEASQSAQQLVLLDEHDNALCAIVVPAGDSAAAGVPRNEAERRAPHTPILRNWITWALPAAALAAVGLTFFVDGQRAKNRLDAIVLDSESHYFDEAERERQTWKTDVVISQLAFAAAAALGATAIVMAALPPSTSARTVIAPSIGRGQYGVVLDVKF